MAPRPLPYAFLGFSAAIDVLGMAGSMLISCRSGHRDKQTPKSVAGGKWLAGPIPHETRSYRPPALSQAQQQVIIEGLRLSGTGQTAQIAVQQPAYLAHLPPLAALTFCWLYCRRRGWRA